MIPKILTQNSKLHHFDARRCLKSTMGTGKAGNATLRTGAFRIFNNPESLVLRLFFEESQVRSVGQYVGSSKEVYEF